MILDEINLQPIPNQEIYYQSFRIRIYQTNSAMAMDLYKDDVAIVLGLRLVNGGLAIPYPALTSDVEGGTSGINFLLDCPTDDIPDYTKFGTEQKLYAFREEDLYEFAGDVFTPANDLGEFGGIDMFKPSPVLSYDFSTMLTLHSDWSLTRASNAAYYDVNGDVQTVGNNLPRFTSFETGGPQAGILLENTSTNLVERSFYGSGYSVGSSVITNNFADTNFPGLKSAKVECPSNSTAYYCRWGSDTAIIYTQDRYYIASVFFRPGINNSPQGVRLRVMDQGANTTTGIRFNPDTMEVYQEIGNLTAYKIKPLPNGVYKLIIIAKADATDTGSGPIVSVGGSTGQLAGDYFECWGFQLEERTNSGVLRDVKAPITTTGSALTVPIDDFRITSTNLNKYISKDNFTIFSEFFTDTLWNNTSVLAFRLYQSDSEKLEARFSVTSSWRVQFERATPAITGSGVVTISPSMPISTWPKHLKVAMAVRNGNEISIAVNGMVFSGVMDAALLPSANYNLQLGNSFGGTSMIYKKVDYYDTALSNEVMQQMTGL